MAQSTRDFILACMTPEQGASEDFTFTACNILEAVISANHSTDDLETDDIREALCSIDDNIGDDFALDFDGNEYRIIHDADIWDIYVEEIKNIVQDCYSDVLNMEKIPAFISVSIDWGATAHNTYVDGYGHTFASYDGNEIECKGYHIFRTN
jgi:hypothetical protein